jgi:hypothetical protein
MFQTNVNLLLVLFLFRLNGAVKIVSKFNFCTVSENSKEIDHDFQCHDVGLKGLDTKANHVYHVLSKTKEYVQGPTHHCSMTKVTITTYTTLFGSEYRDRQVEEVFLSFSACWEMIFQKKCSNKPMTCDSMGNCHYKTDPAYSYSWLTSLTFTGHHCVIVMKEAISTSRTEPMFSGSTSRCLPTDTYCQFGNSVIVWNSTIIHNCPFVRVHDRIEFKIIDDHLVSQDKTIALQTTGKTNECNMDIYTTAEGLYLTNSDYNVDHLPIETKIAQNTAFSLILSDIDYKEQELMQKMYSNMRTMMCFVFKLQLEAHRNDGFFRIHSYKDEDLILYNEDGTYVIPDCVPISTIHVRNETTDKCFANVPVDFEDSRVMLKNGFIDEEGVITSASPARDCSQTKRIALHDSGYVAEMRDRSVTIKKGRLREKVNYKFMAASMSKLNFDHNQKILNTINVIDILREVTSVSEGDFFFNMMPSNNTMSKGNRANPKQTNRFLGIFELSGFTHGIQVFIEACIVIGMIAMVLLIIFVVFKMRICFLESRQRA